MKAIGSVLFTFFLVNGICHFSEAQTATKGNVSAFDRSKLTGDFLSEGVAVGDINKDGKTDIIAGYYWFEAPDWKRHEIAPSRIFDPAKEYSNSFLNLGMDVNQDGWVDLVLVDFPGKPGMWFENPKNKTGHWQKHDLYDSMGIANESPAFVDIDKDGRPDILCADPKTKEIVWLKSPGKGQTKWTRFVISDTSAPGTNIFSHGIGYGDIDKDGNRDVIVKQGWWKAPKDPKQKGWEFHAADLGEDCSHMQVYDVNGDGINDVISSSAHRLGIWWYEQSAGSDGKPQFTKHLFSEATSQTHSTIMTDINRDGRPDFITGKRYLAHHGSNDPGTFDPSLLLWFESTPGKAPYWIEHQIDNDSGAGLNITVHDMNKDGRMDIIIANKKGVYLFLNNVPKGSSGK